MRVFTRRPHGTGFIDAEILFIALFANPSGITLAFEVIEGVETLSLGTRLHQGTQVIAYSTLQNILVNLFLAKGLECKGGRIVGQNHGFSIDSHVLQSPLEIGLCGGRECSLLDAGPVSEDEGIREKGVFEWMLKLQGSLLFSIDFHPQVIVASLDFEQMNFVVIHLRLASSRQDSFPAQSPIDDGSTVDHFDAEKGSNRIFIVTSVAQKCEDAVFVSSSKQKRNVSFLSDAF